MFINQTQFVIIVSMDFHIILLSFEVIFIEIEILIDKNKKLRIYLLFW